MKNKKLILAAVALVAVVAIFLGIWVMTKPQTQQGAKAFTLTVVHADGSTKTFELRTDEEFLADALKNEGILLTTEGSDGMYNTVDGEVALWDPDQAYWSLYIGEDYAMTGANDTPVNDGDTFKWVYTVYSE